MKLQSYCNNKEELADFFGIRAESYRFLSLFFAREPDKGFLRFIAESKKDLLGLFSWNQKCFMLIDRLADEAVSILESDADDKLTGLQSDYHCLFVGPSGPYAPPWESVHTSEDKLLFGESTFTVRNEYKKFGFQFSLIDKEPDDHIAAELQFIACLLDLAIKGMEEKQFDYPEEIIKAQKKFLDNHICKWTESFCDLIYEKTKENYFKTVSMILREFVKSNAEEIEALLSLEISLTLPLPSGERSKVRG